MPNSNEMPMPNLDAAMEVPMDANADIQASAADISQLEEIINEELMKAAQTEAMAA